MTQSPVSVDKKTTTAPETSPKSAKADVKHPALLLAATALDTTWRVILPGVIGVVIGLLLDRSWHTIPVFSIIGVALGIALSVYLVYQQLKTIK